MQFHAAVSEIKVRLEDIAIAKSLYMDSTTAVVTLWSSWHQNEALQLHRPVH